MNASLRLVVIFAILIIILGFISAPLRANAESAFVLQIAAAQNAIFPGSATFRIGAPIFLVITMKSNSQRVLNFALTNPAFNYRARVLDSTGKLVPKSDNLRRVKEELKSGQPIESRNVLVTLKPQQTCQDTFELSYWYELVHPGGYTVQLEREMPPEVGSGIVKSNVLSISLQ